MTGRFFHGGNISATGRSLGVRERELLDFSANINPLGLAPEVRRHLQNSFWRLEHYPDPENRDSLEALSLYHHCHRHELVLGNGAAELFQLLCMALKPERVVAVEPTYSGYAFAAELNGIAYVGLEQDARSPVYIPALAGKLRRGDLLFFCNPNNPTGRVCSREAVDVLVQNCENVGATLVLDESFHAFLPLSIAPKSYIDEGQLPDHVVVVRSLTKIMALPGLRLGYLRATRELARAIRAKRDPWSVNALALEAARLYPRLTAYINETQTLVKRENSYLRKAMPGGFRVVSGEVNYLFVSIHNGDTSTGLCSKLLGRRIMVRNCSTFPGLGEGYIRIAVRKHEENQRLLEALAEATNAVICDSPR